jgi:hypothetical protein
MVEILLQKNVPAEMRDGTTLMPMSTGLLAAGIPSS